MSKHRVRLNLTLLAAALSSIAWSAQAASASSDFNHTDDDGAVPEVLVSAQRIVEPAARTPVALSVIGGDAIDAQGIDRPSDLAKRLPNVSLDGAADGLKITIRGISNADTTEKGDPSAAFLLDGVYLARPQSQNGTLYDIERVEVLRGPQGTLYGRNATAGVVNVITRAPGAKREGAAAIEVGNDGARRADAMLNVPVSNALALRAALVSEQRDSFLRNGQGTGHALGLDRDARAARLSARLALGTDASLVLRYDDSSAHDNPDATVQDGNFYHGVATGQPVWYAAGTAQRLENRFVPPNGAPVQGHGARHNSGLAGELHWKLGGAELTYLGSRRHFDDDFLTNYYYRVAPTLALGVREQFSGSYRQDSHELRIATDSAAAVSAQAGLYYFRDTSTVLYGFRDLELLGLPPYYVFPHGPTVARSVAAFGQASWRVTPSTRLTAGARRTEDDKSRVGSTNFQQGPVFNPATDLRLLNAAALETGKTTWRLGAEHVLAPATLLYGAMSTGYKAGGFNDGCLAGTRALGIDCPAAAAVAQSTLVYRPETVRAVEAGLKTRFWHQAATLNLAAFRYDYDQLQLSGVAIVAGAPRYVTSNAGQAAIRGVEADGEARLASDDHLRYALTWLDAHYVRYVPDGIHSLAGHRLDRAPRRTAMLRYEHRFMLSGGQLRAGIDLRASGAYVIGVPTQLLEYHVPGHSDTDFSLAWQADGAPWRAQLRVKNVENAVRPVTIDSFGMVVPSDPRTLTVRVDYRF